VVATGTPEDVAEVEGSYTGRFLTPLLAKSSSKRAVRGRREPVAA